MVFLEYRYFRLWPRPKMTERKDTWQELALKVHDTNHLVHFWNPQSPCGDHRYDLQFSVLLSTCYSEFPGKHLLIELQKTIEGCSLAV
jgi:hypothetical protein